MPFGTVITRFRPPTLITTYAVITLVMLAIGRSLTEERLHRLAPVTAFAISAQWDCTPMGALAADAARAPGAPGAAATIPAASSPAMAPALTSRTTARIMPPSRTARRIHPHSASTALLTVMGAREFSSERARGVWRRRQSSRLAASADG